MSDQRVRLIERICRLPAERLGPLETFLDTLEKTPARPKDWPHAPVHRLFGHGTFIVTASTLHKEHLFRGENRLSLLESAIHRLAKQHRILVEAWAVFSNHYHLIAHVECEKNPLAVFLSQLHTETATEINRTDNAKGRKVWFNFWDTQLTFEKSYLARLNYVHQNPVKHGLVKTASDYRWCSAAWFERTGTPAQIKTIYSFKIDRVKVDDNFEPVI